MVKTMSQRNRKAINSRAIVIQRSLFGYGNSELNSESDLESTCSELHDPDIKKGSKKTKLMKEKPPKQTFKSELFKKLKKKKKSHKKRGKSCRNSKFFATSSSLESWYCYLCKKDAIKKMTSCSSCLLYVHDECIGLREKLKNFLSAQIANQINYKEVYYYTLYFIKSLNVLNKVFYAYIPFFMKINFIFHIKNYVAYFS